MIYLIFLSTFGVAAVYAGVVSLLWRFQERVVFQPPAAPPTEVPAKRVAFRTSDGVHLFAYVVGECDDDASARQRTIMLAFHGNADVARWLVPWATEVARETGVCVVLPEYRGYDGAAGTPSYANSELDARAALDLVRNTMHVAAADMVFFGHSLGSAIVTELAAAETPRALVLQSPFSSARDMAARMFVPGLTFFWKAISRVHFNTRERVHSLRAPVWVAHGDRDLVIPVRMGREVFEAAGEKGRLLIVRGAGHNNVPDIGGREYWSWLASAVRGARVDMAGAPTAPDARAETR